MGTTTSLLAATMPVLALGVVASVLALVAERVDAEPAEAPCSCEPSLACGLCSSSEPERSALALRERSESAAAPDAGAADALLYAARVPKPEALISGLRNARATAMSSSSELR